MGEIHKGKVQTVCGPIDPSQLGVTLCHEHLYFTKQPIDSKKLSNPKYSYLNDEPVKAETMWWTTFNPYSHKDNKNFSPNNQFNSIINEEMKFYKSNGGNSVVEVTTFGKCLKEMKQTSMQAGINIIAGAGYYQAKSLSLSITSMTTEQIYDSINHDILFGEEGIRCGVIGEIASDWPIQDFEKRVLKASGQVHEELKIPVIIHPGRDAKAPFEVMRLYQEAGGKADKTVMSHLERTLFDDNDLLEFAELKAYNEFDLFGNECSYYQVNPLTDFPNDSTRINRLKMLIDHGFGDKITISHDIHTKHRLMKYGGHGFSHILLNAIPKMKLRGFTEENINDIMINNPKTWLAID